jgi:hypothetical protein
VVDDVGMAPQLPSLLTPHDVGLWLSMRTGRVLRLARDGRIPCRRLPCGDILFDPAELTAWLDSLRSPGEVAHAG